MTAWIRDDMTADELQRVLGDVLDELTAGLVTPAAANTKAREVRKRLAIVASAMRAARMRTRLEDP